MPGFDPRRHSEIYCLCCLEEKARSVHAIRLSYNQASDAQSPTRGFRSALFHENFLFDARDINNYIFL